MQAFFQFLAEELHERNGDASGWWPTASEPALWDWCALALRSARFEGGATTAGLQHGRRPVHPLRESPVKAGTG